MGFEPLISWLNPRVFYQSTKPVGVTSSCSVLSVNFDLASHFAVLFMCLELMMWEAANIIELC